MYFSSKIFIEVLNVIDFERAITDFDKNVLALKYSN